MADQSGKPFDPRARALRRVALAIVGALLLALVCFFASWWLRLAAFFSLPAAGAFGAAAEDLYVSPEHYAALKADAHALRVWATAVSYLSLALVALAVVGTAWCARQTWAAVKRWHWLSFLGLTCLLALLIVGNWVATSKPAMLELLALDAVAFACAALDLTRRQYGTPGRVVAWATGVLSLGAGALLWSEALGPNGFIGRWLH